ncbi:MAG: 2-oxoglutarate ferredoxin oxidoreductase subunit alpha [Omnitrophica bacterium RIFCSPHIGHO2_02_FULL_51_18]|nr:MAG: 2-oxoglutarate ferredoxin oxidoreductase subunit alpha [Omnitrophica bacterium RIFCSPHIGHO2_02_FULL_51_18]
MAVKHLEKELESVTIRFAGDSGDGMQLTGDQFTDTSALMGNDIATLPDFPAEIRAPQGTLPGVSSFQIQFSHNEIYTAGDAPDVLVVMNPAALKVNLNDLAKGGLLVLNIDSFTEKNLKKAGWKSNPLTDSTLKDYSLLQVPFSSLTKNALVDAKIKATEVDRCKNFFALGLMFWIYGRTPDHTIKWIRDKFGKKPEIAEANILAVEAGYNYGDITETIADRYVIKKADIQPGVYRKITGNEATAIGIIAAAQLAQKEVLYGSYPITPASNILHELSKRKNFRIKTFQAEDEIAACGAALGASFGGHIGVTATSGPGICLKSEMINLAVMAELPLVILNVQRGGPSTGLPTKTEQSDLLQALFGRNGDSPVAVIAASTPSNCFDYILEAIRIALKYMCPVFFLSDGYIANGSEPWKLPEIEKLPKINVIHPQTAEGPFLPYVRDEETLARPWAVPGTQGLQHRIGGIEKANRTGAVSYDAENHQKMTFLRREKIQRIANDIPDAEVLGEKKGGLLVLGWGGTYGSITAAVTELQKEGKKVSACHLHYINPFPKNLGSLLKNFETILIPELNTGQLILLIRGEFEGVHTVGLNKIKGQPFKIAEIKEKIKEELHDGTRYPSALY